MTAEAIASEEGTEGALSKDLAEKLAGLPSAPGCYLFLDKDRKALYVGKAKSLRARVRSYFQQGSSDARYFVPLLRRMARDLETVVTTSEKEAAVLENELIKKHQPRFNFKLRDDKDFLCLKLNESTQWPRLETVRRPGPDGSRYFGPYHSATSARRTLHLVNKHFMLRTCSDADFASRKRPCLQFQIQRCPAPCVMPVNEAEYRIQTNAVAMFLEGRHDELTGTLRQEMQNASRSLEYERARVYRDQIHAVETMRQNQRVVSVSDTDQDVIGLYREGSVVELVVVLVRRGRVSETLSFSLRKIDLPDEEVIANFLSEYYHDDRHKTPMPAEVIVPCLPDGATGFAEWLSEKRQQKVEILFAQRGPRKKLLDLAMENARHSFSEKRRNQDDIEARLADLQEKLKLPTLPRRIECCDISHTAGTDTVGAVVALRDGVPDKKRYRTYKVRCTSTGDDYTAMYEVLARRFRRGRTQIETRSEAGSGAESEWELPDLFVVDGGRGQLNVALAAARDLGIFDLPVVGLAKERESVTGETVVDRVYLPGQKNGLPLKSASSALFFLARARDEAHRFANFARQRGQKNRVLRSALGEIPGIGKNVERILLRQLGSLNAVKAASDEDLLSIEGVTKRHLAAIRLAFPKTGTRPSDTDKP